MFNSISISTSTLIDTDPDTSNISAYENDFISNNSEINI